MGAGASHQTELFQTLKQEGSKPTTDIDTPRGVTAKNEVIRLRQLMAKNAALLEAASNQREETDEGETSSDDDSRAPCEFCNRKFNPDRLAKHVSVCLAKKKQEANGNPVVEDPAKETNPATTDAADAPPTDAADAPPTDAAPKKVNKWKEDRKKMREKLKRDRMARKAAATPATTSPNEEATQGAAEPTEGDPATPEAQTPVEDVPAVAAN